LVGQRPVKVKTDVSERFILWLAAAIIFGGGAFLWKAAFTPAENTNELTNFIVGFVCGSVLGVVITYLYGTSKSSADKDKMIK
jgi:ABC-type nitrate/sulfonate/bicarbonate transport system permease component